MGVEIERKFLVTGDGWRHAAHKTTRMAQQSRYYNLALAEHPFKRWTDLEKS